MSSASRAALALLLALSILPALHCLASRAPSPSHDPLKCAAVRPTLSHALLPPHPSRNLEGSPADDDLQGWNSVGPAPATAPAPPPPAAQTPAPASPTPTTAAPLPTTSPAPADGDAGPADGVVSGLSGFNPLLQQQQKAAQAEREAEAKDPDRVGSLECTADLFPNVTFPTVPFHAAMPRAEAVAAQCRSFCWLSRTACASFGFQSNNCKECCERVCAQSQVEPARPPPEPSAAAYEAALEDPFTQALGRSAIPVAALTRDTGPSQELRRAVRDAILAGDVARLRVALRGLGQDVTSCIGCRVEESPKEYLECGECMIGNFGAIHLVAEMWKHGPPDKASAWPDMLTLLVDDFGIDPDQPDMDAPEQQETALFWALEAHSGPQDAGKAMPTIQALLKLGADVNKAGFGGWTPAARAAAVVAWGGPEPLKAVVGKGGNPNVKNLAGFTATMLVSMCWVNDNHSCGGESAGNALQWLLTDGYGDATLEDDNGRTARDLVRVCASDPRVWPPPTTVCQSDTAGATCLHGPCHACCASYRALEEAEQAKKVQADWQSLLRGRWGG